MRGFYEKFLPFNEFKHSLISIGEQILESPDWVPNILRSNDILSLPDFWAMLPNSFAGRVTFEEDELFPLFCAIADPSRFGTADNRYPKQLQQIGDFIKQVEQGRAVRILDLGCGVGLGTCELAQIAAAVHGSVIGVTSEHLEVWMAQNRRLPHDATRERLFRRYPTTLPVTFTYGFAESYRDDSQYDVIVCNGLAGGRFLNAAPQLTAFLTTCDTLLAPRGRMFIANRFHEGERLGVERLRRLAHQSGWSVEGHWQSLVLTKTL
jgi:predicted TPR repeat methyltransferase